LKALKSVLPTHVKIFPVGGIGANDIAQWRQAGANGFGFGSELFKPDYSLDDIATRARQIMNAYQA
jgi:2-dehydro-3-deoxyphosphogalactonate aldolase